MSTLTSNGNRPEHWILSNEFAQVRLSIDREGQDLRLKIEDMRNDTVVFLDAFQLAGLTTASEAKFTSYMDPGKADS